jgi:hypothetical protein
MKTVSETNSIGKRDSRFTNFQKDDVSATVIVALLILGAGEASSLRTNTIESMMSW